MNFSYPQRLPGGTRHPHLDDHLVRAGRGLEVARGRTRPRAISRASRPGPDDHRAVHSASSAIGRSAAGSACASEPPMVPRCRICGSPTSPADRGQQRRLGPRPGPTMATVWCRVRAPRWPAPRRPSGCRPGRRSRRCRPARSARPAAASSSAAASGRRPAAWPRRRARRSRSTRLLGRPGGDVVERRGDHCAHLASAAAARPGRCCGSRCSGRGCPPGLRGPPPRSGAGSPRAGRPSPSPCPGVQNPHCSPCSCAERRLHRVQLAVRPDRPSAVVTARPVGLHGQHRAGLHRFAVQQHRAGAAGGGVAADVRRPQPAHLPQVVDQQQPRLDLVRARLSPLTVSSTCITARFLRPCRHRRGPARPACGEVGMSMCRTPRWATASTRRSAPPGWRRCVPASPMPLTPSGLYESASPCRPARSSAARSRDRMGSRRSSRSAGCRRRRSTTSSSSACAAPWAMPPCRWPSASSGLSTNPASSTVTIRRSIDLAGLGVHLDHGHVRAERERRARAR